MPVIASQFNSGLSSVGIGYDPLRNEVIVYGSFAATVSRFDETGALIGTFANPGGTANDFDIDGVAAGFSMGGTFVPAGSVLLFNGEVGPLEIRAVDPVTGAVIAVLNTAFGDSHVVGGSYHPIRGTFFVVQDRVPGGTAANRIAEIDAATGAVLNTFLTTDALASFAVNFGDLDVDPVSGDLFVVSSDESSILRLSPTGDFVETIDLPAGVSGLSGIATNPERLGEAWVVSSSGVVTQLLCVGSGNEETGTINDDILAGTAGVDCMVGLEGNDRYTVNNVADMVVEAAGEGFGDYIFSSVSYTNAANAERLYLTGTEDIDATGRDGQDDILVGNEGANTLDGKGGRDIMQGRGGNDVYRVDQLTDIVTENAGEGTDFIFTTGSFQIAENAERLIAVEGANAVGLTARNFQNDIIIGNSSTNVFVDQFGRDIFVGGGGADFFRFIANLDPVNNVNRINDFNSADDQFQLLRLIYTEIDVGILDASEFVLGTAASDADDRIIYDQPNGVLYYDPDGTGAAAQIEIVNVTAGITITADDFQIY